VPAHPARQAADQRDEQQQVDRGEPGRAEDVEQAEVPEQRAERRVVVLVPRHQQRVDVVLRQQRARDSEHREQEQQDQRGAHAGQHPPAAAHRVDDPGERATATARGHRTGVGGRGLRLKSLGYAERVRLRNDLVRACLGGRRRRAPLASPRVGGGCRGWCHSGVSANPGAIERRWKTSSVHWPVTCRTPTATSSTPPVSVSSRAWDRTTASAPTARRNDSPTARKGTPSPRQYTAARNAPRPADALCMPNPSTALSVGPMHGVQPRPNMTPSNGAPSRPGVGRRCSCTSRLAHMNREKTPANSSPITIVSAPRTWASPTWWTRSQLPRPPNRTP